MAGVKIVPVHYRGATPALNDLIGGTINTMTVSVASGLPAYRAGQIKMLGIGSPKRWPRFPMSRRRRKRTAGLSGQCLVRPVRAAGMPHDVVMKIDSEVIRIFNDPAFRARFLDPQMFESMAGPPDEFAAFIKTERAKWSKVIREANIKLEYDTASLRRRAVGGQNFAGEIQRAGDQDARRRLEIEPAGHRRSRFRACRARSTECRHCRRFRRAPPRAPSCPDGSAPR